MCIKNLLDEEIKVTARALKTKACLDPTEGGRHCRDGGCTWYFVVFTHPKMLLGILRVVRNTEQRWVLYHGYIKDAVNICPLLIDRFSQHPTPDLTETPRSSINKLGTEGRGSPSLPSFGAGRGGVT